MSTMALSEVLEMSMMILGWLILLWSSQNRALSSMLVSDATKSSP
ncbi:hypothetical protein MFUL124B02_29710 [Myxococcus fulvus 124B02]|nr:hypothetical protein MFUL124B02_29710 [Myxococcus fulvus 124B02]